VISIEKTRENGSGDYIIAGLGVPWRLSLELLSMLSVSDHRRDSAGMTYVYPVVSRRAGGVSVGINLNVNNACNWACVYCQVPELTRGGPPPIDLALLEIELRSFLHDALSGDFLLKNAPPDAQRLVDVAFSGNGEPTSAPEFSRAVECVAELLLEFGLLASVKMRLITNGSLMHRPLVQQGIARLGELDGEIWFKVDRATPAGMAQVNGVQMSPLKVREALLLCASLAPTWVQTCCFAIDGEPASDAEQSAYLELIESVKEKIKGVHLYGLARPSLQPDASRLSNLSSNDFQRFARSVSSLNIEVVANP
jgi:wyosine [tRNA(Phe)-imidazoG37] synthetase (radical SAM superfamily)